MAIVYTQSSTGAWICLNEENGDWLVDVSGEFGRPPIMEVSRFYRLHRGDDRQMFEVNVTPEQPSREIRAQRLKLESEGKYTRDDRRRNLFKAGMNLEITSGWGKFFPEEQIDVFMPYLFEFFYAQFKYNIEFLKIEYVFPQDGRKFEFYREGV